MINYRYNDTVSEVLEALENAYMDILHQARLFAMETDLKQAVEEAMQSEQHFFITNEMLSTCTDENVKRCLRSAENIIACLEVLGRYYRTSPDSNAAYN